MPHEGPVTRLEWRVATVRAVQQETPSARTLLLDVPEWPGHRAGQHVDVRLVAEDGYAAERSYSIASPPEEPLVALTVERIENAEVSPYLCDVLQPGDGLEVRGPIGGYFVWEAAMGGPVLLVAGGSGVVPLMAMLRHQERMPSEPRGRIPVRLLHSARTWDDVFYRAELQALAAHPSVEVFWAITREMSGGNAAFHRRIDRAMLETVAWPPSEQPLAYVCGPTPLVELVANTLVDLGHEPARIRTERFGPTG